MISCALYFSTIFSLNFINLWRFINYWIFCLILLSILKNSKHFFTILKLLNYLFYWNPTIVCQYQCILRKTEHCTFTDLFLCLTSELIINNFTRTHSNNITSLIPKLHELNNAWCSSSRSNDVWTIRSYKRKIYS